MTIQKIEEIQRTYKIIETFNIKNGKEFTQFYSKSGVTVLLADVFQKFIKVSVKEFGIISSVYTVIFARIYMRRRFKTY